MPLTFTNLALVALTLLAAAASALAGLRLRSALTTPRPAAPGDAAEVRGRARSQSLSQAALVGAIGAGALGLLAYRFVRLPGSDLLHAHVDGLLLIAALLAGVALYLQTRPRLQGVAAFALPLLTFLLLWAVCASAWTYRPFRLTSLQPVWRGVHLGCVYLGTLGAALAAGAGAAYLVFARRLKRRADPRGAGRVASLEAVEGVIVRSATLGFALLSAGGVSGWVIMRDGGGVGGADGLTLTSPKVLLSAGAWAAFAVVMNVRYATAFRGKRAAWLAIAGFALLLGVYGIVTAGPGSAAGPGFAPAAGAFP